jgi:hypothetical protein
LLLAATAAAQQKANQDTVQTRVLLLGTGTLVPDPDRSGPATAVVVGDSVYSSISDPVLCVAPSWLLSTEKFHGY